MLTEKDRNKLYKFFEDGCKDIAIEPEYWIFGADGGRNFCYACCSEEVNRLNELKEADSVDEYKIDGGTCDSEGDSLAFCDKCEKLLENSLTFYGAKQEIDFFMEEGFNVGSIFFETDCYSMMKVIDATDWEPWDNDEVNDDILNYYEKLDSLGQKILKIIGEKD